jgi:hypothetical protein
MINKRFDPGCDCITVIGNGLMGNLYPVHIVHQRGGLAERQGIIDVVGQDQTKDMV